MTPGSHVLRFEGTHASNECHCNQDHARTERDYELKVVAIHRSFRPRFYLESAGASL